MRGANDKHYVQKKDSAQELLFSDEELISIKKRVKTLTIPMTRTERGWEAFTETSIVEITNNQTTVLVFDLEIFPNYFLAAFRCFHTKRVIYFELTPESKFDIHLLLKVMHRYCLVGFNSLNFDLPLLWLSLQPDVTNETLYNVCGFIIKGNMRPNDIEKMYNFKMGQINHIDLIEVAPLKASLKTYGGRLHAPRLQDLPYDPDMFLSKPQCVDVLNYCVNDLEVTHLLLNELYPQLELRHRLSLDFKQDLRSKSDAQIAEAVIGGEITKVLGYRPKRPKIEEGTTFKYEIPEYIKYKTPQLQQMYEIVKNADFVVRDTGKVVMPEEISKLRMSIGSSIYKMGIGGLHSTESSVSHRATDLILLLDRDVASFYPRIILNLRLFPKHLTEAFLKVYESLVNQRLDAKAKASDLKKQLEELEKLFIEFEKETQNKLNQLAVIPKNEIQIKELKTLLLECKTAQDCIKISINGGFGKFGSKWSLLFAPDLMITVTMTGQLSLLMLIEMIELVGIPVVSGNTDGIIIKCPVERYDELNAIIAEWEKITRFETEETRYKGVYSADVNNYFAIKEKECKVKGRYAERGSALNSVLSKNPENLICSDAMIALLTDDIPIEKTIIECKDIRRFITLRQVKGGAEKDGIYLGKTVRYYYGKGETGTINYVMNGNKVANSEGAFPAMDLPESFPDNIDYDKYLQLTTQMLFDVAYYERERQITFF
jgi:hypothetical protein